MAATALRPGVCASGSMPSVSNTLRSTSVMQRLAMVLLPFLVQILVGRALQRGLVDLRAAKLGFVCLAEQFVDAFVFRLPMGHDCLKRRRTRGPGLNGRVTARHLAFERLRHAQVMPQRRQRGARELPQLRIPPVSRFAFEQRDGLAVCSRADRRDVRDVEVATVLAAQPRRRGPDLLDLRLHALARGDLVQARIRLAVIGHHALREGAHVRRLRLPQRELARLHLGRRRWRPCRRIPRRRLARFRDHRVARARRRVDHATRHM